MTRHRARIAAPAEVVYRLIADPQRRAEWLPELESADAPSRLLAEGDRFDGYTSLPGHRFVGTSVVTSARPPLELSERVTVGARFTTTWRVEPSADDDGVVVTHTIDVELPTGAIGRIEARVLTWWIGRTQRAGLRRLVRLASDAR